MNHAVGPFLTRLRLGLLGVAVVVGVVSLGVVLADPAEARSCEEDWPTYRGDDQRTGSCGNVSGPGTGEVLWSLQTKDLSIPGSPAVVGDTVYFSSGPYIYAVDRFNGSVRWTYETDGGIGSSPAVVNGTLFIGSGDGYVYALETADGTLDWRTKIGKRAGVSPAVQDGRVYTGPGGPRIVALNASTGEELWDTSTAESVTVTPAIWKDRVLVGDRGETFYSLGAENGSIQWTKDLDGAVRGSPSLEAGKVFTPSGVGWLHALDPRTGEAEWERDFGFDVLTINTPAVKDQALVATTTGDHVLSVNVSDGTTRWNQTWQRSFAADAAIGPGTVYVAEHSGTIRALNASTGEQAWSLSPTPLIRSSPTLADGILYVGSDDFEFFAIDAGIGPEALEGDHSNHSGESDRPSEPAVDPSPGPGLAIVLGILGLGALVQRSRA